MTTTLPLERRDPPVASTASRLSQSTSCRSHRPASVTTPLNVPKSDSSRPENTRSRVRRCDLRLCRALRSPSPQVTSGANHDRSPKQRWATVFDQSDLDGRCESTQVWCVIGILSGEEELPDGFSAWLKSRNKTPSSTSKTLRTAIAPS